MLAGGRVRVNGTIVRRADTALAAGDVVEVGPRRPRAALPPGLALVYEDDDVIVVEKPAGLLTIATERERERTVYAQLTAHARARACSAPASAPPCSRGSSRPGGGPSSACTLRGSGIRSPATPRTAAAPIPSAGRPSTRPCSASPPPGPAPACASSRRPPRGSR